MRRQTVCIRLFISSKLFTTRQNLQIINHVVIKSSTGEGRRMEVLPPEEKIIIMYKNGKHCIETNKKKLEDTKEVFRSHNSKTDKQWPIGEKTNVVNNKMI